MGPLNRNAAYIYLREPDWRSKEIAAMHIQSWWASGPFANNADNAHNSVNDAQPPRAKLRGCLGAARANREGGVVSHAGQGGQLAIGEVEAGAVVGVIAHSGHGSLDLCDGSQHRSLLRLEASLRYVRNGESLIYSCMCMFQPMFIMQGWFLVESIT